MLTFGNYKCNKCERSFRREDYLERHFEKHRVVTSNLVHFEKLDPKIPIISLDNLLKNDVGDFLQTTKELEVTKLLDSYRKGIKVPQKTTRKYKRKPLSQYQKRYVAWDQQYKCIRCKELLPAAWEVDHIIPVSRGGTNELSNLNAYCPSCHSGKTWLEGIENHQMK